MKKILFLLLFFLTGCSSYSEKPISNKGASNVTKQYTKASSSKNSSNQIKMLIDSAVIGAASVSLGSLALHKSGKSFKFSDEGGFEKSTKYGGMDKLGHAWYTNVISDVLYSRIEAREGSSKRAALKAAGVSFGIMTLIEVADGFATNSTGFSSGDLIADALGASLSYVRNTNPKIQKIVDYRIEYLPNYTRDKGGIGQFYSDQKYLLAWKFSGLNSTKKNNPLRFLELHTGYYARGFSDLEKSKGMKKTRNLYVGIGINLNELFFAKKKGEESKFKEVARGFMEHVQLPYTYGELIKLK